jgi:hypothetical protein
MKKALLLLFFYSITLSTFACYCSLNPLTQKVLDGYKFISVVKVKKLSNLNFPNDFNSNYQSAEVETLENFKGKIFTKIIITSVKSSCDMGVREGDVWIFFANELKGEPILYPCGHSTTFLSQDKVDTYSFWHYPKGIGTLNYRVNGHLWS